MMAGGAVGYRPFLRRKLGEGQAVHAGDDGC